MFEFLKYSGFPYMIMAPDEGDAGGGSGGGSGDETPPSGDETPPSGDETPPSGDADGGDTPPAGDETPPKDGDDATPPKDGDDGGDTPPAGDETPPKDGDDKPLKDGEGADAEKTWREDYAGDDKKKLAFLNRISSQKALIDKVFEQENIIRSGKHKEALGDDATDEEKAAFREKNGVPAEAQGYLDHLPDGLVLGEDIVENAGDYLNTMHEMNASPEVVAQGLQAFSNYEEKYAQDISARDVDSQNTAIEELKEEWGTDYNANLNTVNNFIETNFPQDIQEALKSGRLGDDGGTPLMSDANIMKAFATIQRQLNPLGTTTPGIGMDQIDGINEQIKKYEDRMNTKSWFNDTKAQDHYQDLLRAKEKFTPK